MEDTATGAAMTAAKILAVDDDEATLLALRAILSDLGQPVVCAGSGEEALRLLLRDDFAIILLDVRMPGMDGYETASFIRNRSRTRHVPIIFLSAMDKEDRHQFQGYAAGAVDYVFKPIEPVVLRAKVSVFIELHAKAQEIRRQAKLEKRLLEENFRVRTQQWETAEALRRSLAQQTLVIDTLPIALFVASRDDDRQVRTFVGGKLDTLLGVPEHSIESVQNNWVSHIHESDRDRLDAALDELDHNGSASLEYRFRCGTGTYRWFFERLSLAEEGVDGAQEIVGVLFDITARKAIEEQLAHSQKLEAIGQMTGGIAHDFNNMLSVIIGSLERTLDRDNLDAKVRQRLDLSMQAALNCADLTKRLLGFGRRQPLAPRTVQLEEELARLRLLFGRLLGRRIEISIECQRGLWATHLDPSQLDAAIVNLAINARDAMPSGGALSIVARNVSTQKHDLAVPGLKDGDYVELSVIDAGVGMSPEVKTRALEPFFTTKQPGHGTGLGLSSIHGFMTQSGGGLAIESEPGKGTKVKLYLPKSKEKWARTRKLSRRAVSAAYAGCRVLVVEDDPQVLEMAKSMLESLQCEVLTADSGDAALRMEPELDAISVLFTDCIMPGKTDGRALVLEAVRRRPGLAVLMTSGNQSSLSTGLPAEANIRFLPKPYTSVQLAQELDALLRRGQRAS